MPQNRSLTCKLQWSISQLSQEELVALHIHPKRKDPLNSSIVSCMQNVDYDAREMKEYVVIQSCRCTVMEVNPLSPLVLMSALWIEEVEILDWVQIVSNVLTYGSLVESQGWSVGRRRNGTCFPSWLECSVLRLTCLSCIAFLVAPENIFSFPFAAAPAIRFPTFLPSHTRLFSWWENVYIYIYTYIYIQYRYIYCMTS